MLIIFLSILLEYFHFIHITYNVSGVAYLWGGHGAISTPFQAASNFSACHIRKK